MRRSVCLSVCLFVTFRYCDDTVVRLIKLFPLPGRPIILVLRIKSTLQNSGDIIDERGRKLLHGVKVVAWLSEATECLLTAPLGWAVDGHIIRCGTIGPCQSGASSEILNCSWY